MYTGGIFERGHRSQDSAAREREREYMVKIKRKKTRACR